MSLIRRIWFSWAVIILSKNILSCAFVSELKNATELKDITELEIINGTRNFRIYSKKGSDDKPWFDGRNDLRHVHCVRTGKCEKLTFHTCLGSNISYDYTSLDLTDSFSQEQIEEKLHSYQALKHVPRCWAAVQPFICAVFVPKCEKIQNKDMVYLPSLEMCKLTLEPCRILYNTTYFPEFLKCNETLFPPKCNNDVREMKFNGTGKCLDPLVPAESSSSYYPGIEGCGIRCEDPLYTSDEHRQIHRLILGCAIVCFFSNLFVIITFAIDWKNSCKYPAKIVFYINLCFLILCSGWLAQFTPGSRDDIVCRKDGTLRHSEPSARENLSCIVVFLLVYYFLMAAMTWFVILTYAWNLQAIGKDRVDKQGSYFHLVAWSIPFVLTTTTMSLNKVDGNSIVGVCFVGYMNHTFRGFLLLGPVSIFFLLGAGFIVLGAVKLIGRKTYLNNIKSTSASNKIHCVIVRMLAVAILILVFFIITIVCHLYEFRNSVNWAESLRKYIICKISATYTDDDKTCKMEHRPSVAVMQLHLLCLFGSGVTMSSWCWSKSTLQTWGRFFRKKFKSEVIEEIKMQKHKVIARTWAKRNEYADKGRLSVILCNTYTDPAGLNFDIDDMNSSGTNEISTTWANYLPQFVKRRFALTGGATNSSSYGPRKSSLDSEFSLSVRHVSVESRRNSVDSQVSVKIAEVKTKLASRTRSHGKHGKTKNRRRDFFAAGRKFSSRRESSTSVESQIVAMKKTAYPGSNHKVGFFAHSKSAKNMKRRSASAGLVKPEEIAKFISKDSKLLLPFLQQPGMTTTSDEETSRASFRIHDSRLDIVLRQHEEDGSDDNQNDYSKNDEYHTDDDSFKKQCKLEDILRHLQTSSSFDNIIARNGDENFDSAGSRQSKSSLKSRNSRKSLRHSIRRVNRRNKSTTKKEVVIGSDRDGSFSSYSSEELELPLGGTQSSFSGVSAGKTQSRNSKTSCDVGIQTNAYDIGKPVPNGEQGSDDGEKIETKRNRFDGSSKNKSRPINETRDDSDCDIEMATENHRLLSSGKPKESIFNASEAERLKLQMLLLPSK